MPKKKKSALTDYHVRDLRALQDFAERHGVEEAEWHGADQYGVTAKVVGKKLDNAFGNQVFPKGDMRTQEFVIILKHDNGDELKLNLANLLHIATRVEA